MTHNVKGVRSTTRKSFTSSSVDPHIRHVLVAQHRTNTLPYRKGYVFTLYARTECRQSADNQLFLVLQFPVSEPFRLTDRSEEPLTVMLCTKDRVTPDLRRKRNRALYPAGHFFGVILQLHGTITRTVVPITADQGTQKATVNIQGM
jgi:hypothetical protein